MILFEREFHIQRMAAVAGFVVGIGAAVGCEPNKGGPDTHGWVDGAVPSECTARYAVARRRPEIVVVLDRSCAMRERFDGAPASGPEDPEGRWGVTRAALLSLAEGKWVSGVGLIFAPDDPMSCASPALRILPGPGSVVAFEELLANNGIIDPFSICESGDVEFPLEGALKSLFDEDPFTSEDPLVLVVTAGAPSCGATRESLADSVSALTELGAEVAIAGLSSEPLTHDLAEVVGPRARQFAVTTPESLQSTLQALLAERESCVLDLVGGPTSPPPSELRVFVDDVEIQADPTEGYSFDASADALTLNGALCDRLLASEIRRIRVGVGCDDPTCVPRAEACDGLDDDCDDQVDEDCL